MAWHSTDTTTVYKLPNQKFKGKLRDQDALALGQESVGTGERGQDSTHYRLRRNWFVHIAYYLGFTDAEYAADAFMEDIDVSRTLSILPFSANHIGRLCRGEISRLAAARPDWDVVPRTPDTRDRQGAKVAQQHLDYYYEKLHLERERYRLGEWMTTCGMGFYYLNWDTRAGKKKAIYKDPFTDEVLATAQLSDDEKQMLSAMGKSEEFREGDMDFSVASPFQVKVPIGPTDWKDVPWITITHLRSLDWIWEHYPEKAKLIEADENDWSIDGHYWRRLASLVSHSGRDFAVRGASLAEGIEVHELWRPAYGRFEKGMRVVFTNNHLLENGVHPFHAVGLDLRYPIFPAYWMHVPGRIWGKSMVEDLLGPQEDYNRSRRQLQNQRSILSKPQWITARQSNLGPTENTTGIIWEYDMKGPPPQMVPPPPVSQAHLVCRDHALYDMQMLSAQSEASLGQNPAGADSGKQVNLLQEADQRTIGSTIASIEDCHAQLGSGLLQLTWKFVRAPRMVEIYGSAEQADVMFFKGSDLNGNTSVRLRPGSMMPRSKAATKAAVAELTQLGVLNPMDPKDRRWILDAYEIGGFEKFFMQEDLDRRRAIIENDKFLHPENTPQFAYPDVDDFDDHMAHIEEHLLFAKTDDYELLPVMRKQAFLSHLGKHQMAIAQQVQTQMLMQGAGGGAGGPGGGSPPKTPGEASQPRQRQETPGTTTVEA